MDLEPSQSVLMILLEYANVFETLNVDTKLLLKLRSLDILCYIEIRRICNIISPKIKITLSLTDLSFDESIIIIKELINKNRCRMFWYYEGGSHRRARPLIDYTRF